MVMRGSRARGTPSPPALVWLSYNTLSVRNSKILQSPLPSSQQGQTGGDQRTVLTATLPGPTLPMCHRLPTSLGPFPLPLGALHLRTLTMFLVKLYLFPLPTSQLCPSLCPNILSILIKGGGMPVISPSFQTKSPPGLGLCLTHHVSLQTWDSANQCLRN